MLRDDLDDNGNVVETYERIDNDEADGGDVDAEDEINGNGRGRCAQ